MRGNFSTYSRLQFDNNMYAIFAAGLDPNFFELLITTESTHAS